MIVVVTLRYLVPMDVVESHTEAHRAFLRSLRDAGTLLVSGPLVPRTGGIILLNAPSVEAAQQALTVDPFQKNGVAAYEFQGWNPVIGQERLA